VWKTLDWKLSYFFQELKATTLTKYFKQQRNENNMKLRLEKLACSVGANIHTAIHVINCFSEETG